MNQEIHSTSSAQARKCQNCKTEFTIEPEDFDFYKKIDVPAPTFCPECRMQRRMAFRNERALYKRACSLCGNNMVSMYSDDATFPVYCRKCWYSDEWNPEDYGREYDFDKDLFSQFKALQDMVPRPALIGSNNVDSPYVNYSANLKNCYLLVGASNDENCGYAYRTFNSKESFDGFGIIDSEYVYESIQATKSFRSSFLKDSEGVIDSSSLLNCRNVSNCIACVNLQNKKYHFFNEEYSKEEYERKKEEEYAPGSYLAMSKLKEDSKKFFLKFPRRFAKVVLSEGSTGNDLAETKNCKHCFLLRQAQNIKFGYFATNVKEGMDFNFADNAELLYESTNIEQNYEEKFSITSWFSRYIDYCDLCFSGSYLFGCIGLRNKEYCILNKQYTKEEYEALVKRIKEHMDAMPYIDLKGREYRYGEFFPIELSPFAYNETVAQEYFSLTETETKEKGYTWKQFGTKDYLPTKAIKDIPDSIGQADQSIAEEIIPCKHDGSCSHNCTKAFRIIPDEFRFYQEMRLPLPRLCPNCRHGERLDQRNPLRLWHRSCQCAGQSSDNGVYQNTSGNHPDHVPGEHCPNEFQTSYSPDRKEIIYCETCYQAEVV